MYGEKMKIIKYLLLVIGQIITVLGGTILYLKIKGIDIKDLNIISSGLLTLLSISFIPLIMSITNDRKRKKLGINGIKIHPVLKENIQKVKIINKNDNIKEELKEICNSLIFDKFVLNFDYEDNDYLEYISEEKLSIDMTKKAKHIKSRLIFDFKNYKESDEIIISSEYEEYRATFDIQNTEIIARIINEMKNEKIIE
jgi:hypothetical protein